MSDTYSSVRSALRAIVISIPGVPAIAWESRPFTPSIGNAYLTERLLPLGTPVATLGTSGWVREEFIYKLTLYSPFNESGLFEHENLVGQIQQSFFPGLAIGGGIDVFTGMVEESRRGPVHTEPDWRVTTVDVEAYFHRSARVA